MKKIVLVFIIILLSTVSMLADGVGTWKNYLSYYEPTEIEKGSGNMLYVLASNGLYTYNTNDQSLQTFDKTNGLSDCTISHIKWNKNTKNLIIVYDNANIDIMYGNSNSDVVNISDYYSKSMTEDKTVNNIYIYGKHALLATAFGIVDVNMENCEISNTYNIGINVDYCYINNNTIYAASKINGTYTCSMSQNMLDKNNWKRTANYTAQKTEDKTELFNIVKTLQPGGPKFNNFGCLKYKFGQLYTCGSALNTNNLGCIQVLNNDNWIIYQDNIQNVTNIKYLATASIAIDPKDKNHVFASGRTGIYEFQNGSFVQHFTEGNSPLTVASTIKPTDPYKLLYILAQTVEYDKEGNLWALTSQTATDKPYMFEYTTNKEWNTWSNSELVYNDVIHNRKYSMPNMTNLTFDSRGLMWFVNDNWQTPSAYCYQPSTEGINGFKTFVNQDGTSLVITYVRCVAEDKNGDMWIGTNQGPLLLEQSKITEKNPLFTQVKVPRNDGTNYADYLLSGVDIASIAVDGGNRKWFGTYGNGVYLISNDNIKEIQHFTTDNSSLLSNNVLAIAINDNTGEVYFGTDKGLCSYMSDASEPAEVMNKDNVYAYPNPVRPDYTGLITVVGLSMNADVKVVTSSGALVAQGRSNGGSFTWDGNDLSGKRVASGIYMVEAATETGEKGVVCKIAIVN